MQTMYAADLSTMRGPRWVRSSRKEDRALGRQAADASILWGLAKMDIETAKQAAVLADTIARLENRSAVISKYIEAGALIIGGSLTMKVDYPSDDTGVTPAPNQSLPVPVFTKEQSEALLKNVIAVTQAELDSCKERLATL